VKVFEGQVAVPASGQEGARVLQEALDYEVGVQPGVGVLLEEVVDEVPEPPREEEERTQRASVPERDAKDADRNQEHTAGETDVDDVDEGRRKPRETRPRGDMPANAKITGPQLWSSNKT
jgi:hypothetical protein